MGVPIRSSMDVVELGPLKNGLPVYFDKMASESDGIIVVNRIKVHTAFKAEIESGLHKMLSVGLVTPPVGMCLNVASAISQLEIGRIFKAAVPFLLANAITLVLITMLPSLSMWLPGLLMK